ncbi:MAG: HAMP domain-containing sensor histidine kinase [Rhodospirillaceae bacterium]
MAGLETVMLAGLLLAVVVGGGIVVRRRYVLPLRRLRAVLETAVQDRSTIRAPSFPQTDFDVIGRGVNQLLNRLDACRALVEELDDVVERARGLIRDNRVLSREVDVLGQARGDAEAANARKSDFLARMSHDLRTPLHGIIGFAEMIRYEMVGEIGNAKYRDFAGDIHQSGIHLLRLINDVLDLSKIEAGGFELAADLIDPGAIIAEVMHALSPVFQQKELVVTFSPPPEMSTLTADEKMVRQMLFNLLSNAIKFSDPGGTIAVNTRIGAEGLEIAVVDHGPGIEPHDLHKVFTEFGQGGNPRTRPAEGTGLGLVIVRSQIELHGGWLALNSSPGQGTSVTLYFPPERLGRRAQTLSKAPGTE